jgi:hypothetical protein
LNFDAGSFYNHTRNGGALPTASWNTTSTVTLSGITTTIPTNISGYSFGNWVHNSAAQSAALSYALAGTTTVYKGDFTLTNSGSGSISFKNSTAAVTATINGTLNIDGGTLLANTGTTAALSLIVNGDYDQTGGSIDLSTVAIGTLMYVDGDYTQSNGTFTQTGTTPSTLYLHS